MIDKWFHSNTHLVCYPSFPILEYYPLIYLQIAAREVSPMFYSHLRLHNGILKNYYPLRKPEWGVDQDSLMWQANLLSTRYIRWSETTG